MCSSQSTIPTFPDKTTAELVHIDLGIAFEQGKILPKPETIPFRLTRDIVDGFGPCGVEGTFRRWKRRDLEKSLSAQNLFFAGAAR
jgi:ataxia telangiectasia mutated family protein